MLIMEGKSPLITSQSRHGVSPPGSYGDVDTVRDHNWTPREESSDRARGEIVEKRMLEASVPCDSRIDRSHPFYFMVGLFSTLSVGDCCGCGWMHAQGTNHDSATLFW